MMAFARSMRIPGVRRARFIAPVQPAAIWPACRGAIHCTRRFDAMTNLATATVAPAALTPRAIAAKRKRARTPRARYACATGINVPDRGRCSRRTPIATATAPRRGHGGRRGGTACANGCRRPGSRRRWRRSRAGIRRGRHRRPARSGRSTAPRCRPVQRPGGPPPTTSARSPARPVRSTSRPRRRFPPFAPAGPFRHVPCQSRGGIGRR